MSKELAFTDDNDVVKYLDTTTAFNLALTADGVAFDLTNAKSVLVKIANDDGYIMQEAIDLTTVTSPLGGTISFPINQDIMNTLVPDDYDIEVWVTMNDGTQAIFPSDGTLGFSIEENLMSDTGEVIPTITLNDFQQKFDDLSSQMENAVHNVQKGDQGNPGNGIKSANNQYQLSDSPITVPTEGWSDTILATTDQLPYLWTKIIFTYDDGTTKEINFVSSRGDTGSQGPIGPVGPQGKQGNGLVVRGKADKEENLPTTGNNQGDGYLVGTDLYIWIDDSWQNMGSITPDLADYVKVADMNNDLNTKVNIADMRKPASDVAGIEEVNVKQDAIGYTPADDSKVVHNSGAEGIGGQKTFDIAPIDKKTGNPYITKDGVPSIPSDVARTGQDANFTRKLQKSGIDVATTTDVKNAVNTATSNVVTTNKLANFTAGLQSGGVSVATSDDLKSVENSAWRQLDAQKYLTFLGGTLLYKIDQNSKRIYMLYSTDGVGSLQGLNSIADFSSIVKNIKTISGALYIESKPAYDESTKGIGGMLGLDSPASITTGYLNETPDGAHISFSDGAYFTYDSLR
ncbi:phage baseplate upper protein [Lentilactobacillus buchneri]|uniref:phage baseplate upper protein n=1 Tax=Lentilactobacillus buchneri TaxID=1581 RepID=UPI0021A8315E|nr:phage baseplate upper protein [Lentilactobacillus buchneri]